MNRIARQLLLVGVAVGITVCAVRSWGNRVDTNDQA